MAVIDADAHVVEWERTCEYMDESERVFAPRVMVFKDQARKPSGRAAEYWMIGGRVFAKDGNIGFDTARETREAADVQARLAGKPRSGRSPPKPTKLFLEQRRGTHYGRSPLKRSFRGDSKVHIQFNQPHQQNSHSASNSAKSQRR